MRLSVKITLYLLLAYRKAVTLNCSSVSAGFNSPNLKYLHWICFFWLREKCPSYLYTTRSEKSCEKNVGQGEKGRKKKQEQICENSNGCNNIVWVVLYMRNRRTPAEKTRHHCVDRPYNTYSPIHQFSCKVAFTGHLALYLMLYIQHTLQIPICFSISVWKSVGLESSKSKQKKNHKC